MKKYIVAMILSSLVVLSGVAFISTVSEGANSVTTSQGVQPNLLPNVIRSVDFATGGQYINNIGLPVSYNTSTTFSALNSVTRWSNELLVVGGSTNYSFSWAPLIGIYSLHSGEFTDLTHEFITALSAGSWYLTAAAWDGSSLLIIGIAYESGSTVPVMASYNPNTGVFTNLSSIIPASDSGWIPSGVAWTGSTFTIVGYVVVPTSTGGTPVMATYNGKTFTDVTATIPSAYSPDYFLGITWVGNGYLITGWEGPGLYPSSSGLMALYSPHSGTFTNLSSLLPDNVYWVGTAAWHGNEALVVGVTYLDTPSEGILNLLSLTYTSFTPSGTDPFSANYYILDGAAWGEGNNFYAVGQTQSFYSPAVGSTAIMCEISF